MSIVDTESVKPVRSSGQKRQGRIAGFVLVVIVVGIGVAYQFLMPSNDSITISDYETSVVVKKDLVKTAQASGTTLIPNQMIIVSPAEGYSDSLLVSLGDTVTKGQALATIDVEDLEEDIEDLEMDLLDAQLDLQQTRLEYQNTVENTEIEIVQLQEDVKELQEDQEKYEKLVAINNARQTELDDISDELEELEETLADTQRELKQSKAVHDLDLALGEALIKQTNVRLLRARKDLDETTIRATMDGDILDIEDEVSVPGSYLEDGDTLFTIADSTSAVFDLELSEEYSSLISLGDRVPVTVGSATVYGTITSIGKIAETSDDGLGATIEVEVTPEVVDDYLPGSTAIGLFTLGTKKDVLTLPRGSYLTTGAQKYVYVVEGNRAIKTAVTFGEIEGNTVQITSGLSAGDEVIISGYQNFISNSEVKLAGE